MKSPEPVDAIGKRGSRKRRRKRPENPIIRGTTLFLLFLTLPRGEAHRSRIPRQGSSSSSSIIPSSAPSLILSLRQSDDNSTTTTTSIPPTVSPLPSASDEGGSPIPSSSISLMPSLLPSSALGSSPTVSGIPSAVPSNIPSSLPSIIPTTLSQPQSIQPTEIIPFRTISCPHNSNITGYESSESLAADIVEYTVEQPYILCPNTTFDDLEVIVGSNQQVPLTVTCGGVDCIWAGNQHITITGGDVDVTMKGITYTGASKSSIVIGMHTNVKARFEECKWEKCTGDEIIRIGSRPLHDNSTKNETAVARSLRSLQQQAGITASFARCSFVDNDASNGILVAYTGELFIDECELVDNTVLGSLIVAEGSTLDVKDLRMIGNNYSKSLVDVGGNATLSSTSAGFCSSFNAPKNDNDATACEGIRIEEMDNCLSLSECPTDAPTLAPSAASLEPSSAPTFVPRACYDTLASLKSAIQDVETRPDELATIRVCSGTTLDGNTEWMDSPIEIESRDIRLMCGVTGDLSENCLIFGGNVQIRIGPKAGRVLISGFTMADAKQVSVLGAGSAGTEALFEKCLWTMNKGIGGVLVYNEADAEPYTGQRHLEQLPTPSSPSMALDFDKCLFEKNFFSFAAVSLVRGHSFFKSTVFRENKTSRLGAVGAIQDSSVGIASSCFMQNQALVDGVIMIDATSNLTRNVQNYGDENESQLGVCTSVFDDRAGSCAIDGNCQGSCVPFNAIECSVPALNSNRTLGPTPPPVVAPTQVPEFPPTPTPEPGTIIDPTPSADSGAGSDSKNGKGPGSIIMAVILVIIVLAIAIWCWGRGKKKDKSKAANKKNLKEKQGKGKISAKDKAKASTKSTRKYDEDEFYDEDDSYSVESDQSSDKAQSRKKGWFGFKGTQNEDKQNQKDRKKKAKLEAKMEKKGKKKLEKETKSRKKKKDDSEDDEDSNEPDIEEGDSDASEASEESVKETKKSGKKVKEDKEDKEKTKKSLFSRASSSEDSVESSSSPKPGKDEAEEMEEGDASSVES